ncbi:hypothetical protein PG993_003636 [Apiospora rasikravindrae]|uniref:Uncharacterized protein n=1 Tax=Apiospora rasikravindrae TaxID=990691 RepID=A0ABR1U2B3_9PEZI
MDNKDHQGSKRSRSQSMTSDNNNNNNKDHKIKEPAPKRHKTNSGRPSSASSTSTSASARDRGGTTSSSTTSQRLSQGPPLTFSGPSPSVAIQAMEELQGIKHDAGKGPASTSDPPRIQTPSQPVHQAKSRNSDPKRKVSAPSFSGPSPSDMIRAIQDMKNTQRDTAKRLGSTSVPAHITTNPSEPAKVKPSNSAPERRVPAASSSSGPSILRRNSTSSNFMPPTPQVVVKSMPVKTAPVAKQSSSEVPPRRSRPSRPELSTAKPGPSSRPEWSTAKSSGPIMNQATSGPPRDRSKEVRLSPYDVLKANGADERYLKEAKRKEQRDRQIHPSSSGSGQGPTVASSSSTSSSSAGPAASAPSASANAPEEGTDEYALRRPSETLGDFLKRKEQHYKLYDKGPKQKKKKPERKPENNSKATTNDKDNHKPAKASSKNDKMENEAQNRLRNITQMNRDRDPVSCIEFPTDLFDALAHFTRSMDEEADPENLQHGYSPDPVYVLILEQNRPSTPVAYFSVCGTAQGMGAANQLALGMFRQEVPRILPELREAAGMAHEDWKESLAQLHKDQPDTNWTKKLWYKATGDIRGSARLSWYVDQDGENKGLVTLSAALPVQDEAETKYQMTVKVLRHKLILME